MKGRPERIQQLLRVGERDVQAVDFNAGDEVAVLLCYMPNNCHGVTLARPEWPRYFSYMRAAAVGVR